MTTIEIEGYATEADLQYTLELIDELKEELSYERQQKQVCADNFMQAMILYNKSEDERKHAEKTNEVLRRTLNHKDEMLEFLR